MYGLAINRNASSLRMERLCLTANLKSLKKRNRVSFSCFRGHSMNGHWHEQTTTKTKAGSHLADQEHTEEAIKPATYEVINARGYRTSMSSVLAMQTMHVSRFNVAVAAVQLLFLLF